MSFFILFFLVEPDSLVSWPGEELSILSVDLFLLKNPELFGLCSKMGRRKHTQTDRQDIHRHRGEKKWRRNLHRLKAVQGRPLTSH